MLTTIPQKFFPKAECILNQTEEKVPQIVENTLVDRFKDISKINIEAIDEYLKRGIRPREYFFRGGKNDLFK